MHVTQNNASESFRLNLSRGEDDDAEHIVAEYRFLAGRSQYSGQTVVTDAKVTLLAHISWPQIIFSDGRCLQSQPKPSLPTPSSTCCMCELHRRRRHRLARVPIKYP